MPLLPLRTRRKGVTTWLGVKRLRGGERKATGKEQGNRKKKKKKRAGTMAARPLQANMVRAEQKEGGGGKAGGR